MSQPTEQGSIWARKMPIREQVQVSRKILSFASSFKGMFIWAIICGIITSMVGVLLPRVIQIYIDRYLQTATLTTQIMIYFVVIYSVLVVIRAFTHYFSTYLFNLASEKTVGEIRSKIYRKINTLGMRYFDQTPAGSIVSRVTNDTETLKNFFKVFYDLFEGVISIIAVFIGMYSLHPQMALIFLLFLPVMALVIYIYQSRSSKIYRTMRENLSMLNTRLNESISGINIIQQFRQEQRFMNEFEEVNEEQYKGRRAMVRMNALLLMPVIKLLESLSLAVVFYILGRQFFDGMIEVGIVYAFTQYSVDFFSPMGMMMDSLSLMQDGVVSSSRILSLLDHEELVPEQIVDPQAEITDARIEFKNLTFSYDGEQDVLKDISFVVEPGTTTAIVGHTGSGKSSIINVLMRFYDYHSGSVEIDGYSLKSFSYDTLRKEIGLVLQDSFIFYGDVLRNIRLLNTTITQKEAQKAAQFVNADRFIEADPKGYNKKVIERGASYSSGQKQLLSFARTMVRQPKILILDEATSNVDTQTEEYIQESLSKMRKGRTTIAIAHRLSTIRDAEQIIVLDKGRIVEKGTHDELIALNGQYSQMYRLQSMA